MVFTASLLTILEILWMHLLGASFTLTLVINKVGIAEHSIAYTHSYRANDTLAPVPLLLINITGSPGAKDTFW
jgi:hypothetical protein